MSISASQTKRQKKAQGEMMLYFLAINTNEQFCLPRVVPTTTIINLKVKVELLTGVPVKLQRLSYLDQGDLDDNSTLMFHDVVDKSTLKMKVWNDWIDLVSACAKGQIEQVLKQGVAQDTDFSNANFGQMGAERRRNYLRSRGFVALLVAAHHGHCELVCELIKRGADLLGKTAHGRNILHVTAANGQTKCIKTLLNLGVANLIDEKDCNGRTAISCTAKQNDSSKILYMFRWNLRTANVVQNIKKLKREDLMLHQLHDSSLKTWMRGKYKQHYQTNIEPLQEFRGTAITSKKSDLYEKRAKTLRNRENLD